MKNSFDQNLYDEEYFERGILNGKSCYENYRWLPELTIPLAARICEYLRIGYKDRILDFGCAKGFLVKAFRLLHREAFGYEQSNYARKSAPEDVQEFFVDLKGGGGGHITYDWIISKDVFEHIPYDEIDSLILNLSRIGRKIFCVIPLAEDGRYVVPNYELDISHIIRENLEWWIDRFERNGFKMDQACYRIEFIKENWSSWEHGNGFFIATSTNF